MISCFNKSLAAPGILFYFFKQITPSKAGVSLARKGLQRARVRIKRSVLEKDQEEDRDEGQRR